jgi:Xaa-Pro dipeptidase
MHDWPRISEQDLRSDRTDRLDTLMRERGLDHLLLTAFDSIRYATGYRTLIVAEGFDWFAAVVDREGESEIFVPWVDEIYPKPDGDLPWIQALHPLPSWAPAIPHASFWIRSLAGVLRARSARRVGFELMYADLLEGLRSEMTEVEFVPVTTELHEIRVSKTPLEIELLTAASDVLSRAAEAAVTSAEAGLLDHEVLAAAMDSLQRSGVEYLSHSLCNVRRGTGTWFPVGNELREGDAFFFDIGCYGHLGYASDMARTGFVGDPPEPVRDAYTRLLEALHVGEETARPGTPVSEVHEAINRYLEGQGLSITPYSTGHGVGLRLCELPTIHRADRMGRDDVLQEGAVIALEPEAGADVEGRFVLLKVEDNYVVERDGVRRLTSAPYYEPS